MNHRPFPLLTLYGMLALLLAACSTASSFSAPTDLPQPSDTPAPDTITPLPFPTSTPSPTLTAAVVSPTPAADTPSATMALNPSPTPLELLNVPIDGGDPSQKFYAVLVYPHYLPAATTSLWFRVYANKPLKSKVDGEGIATVDFVFLDSDGNQVYEHLEKTVGYCAFGGGEPDCVIWDFTSHINTWPNGAKMQSGTYTLKVNVLAKDDSNMFGETTFDILLPQQP